MFSSLGLFKKTKCPDLQHCKRTTCIFSHDQDATIEPVALDIPIHASKPQPQPQKEKPVPGPSSSSTRAQTVPSKRPASELQTSTVGPPRKISTVGSAQKPGAVPTLTQTHVSSDTHTTTRAHDAQDVTHSSLAFPYSKSPPRIP